jgi:hypothetical protein
MKQYKTINSVICLCKKPQEKNDEQDSDKELVGGSAARE